MKQFASTMKPLFCARKSLERKEKKENPTRRSHLILASSDWDYRSIKLKVIQENYMRRV